MKNITRSCIGVALIAATLIYSGYKTYERITERSIVIPRRNIQKGYVDPSKLDIIVQDLDGDAKGQTLLKYDKVQYLFILDEQGRPKVQAYEIRLVEDK